MSQISKDDVKTAVNDPRFAYQNQARHCWFAFTKNAECVKKHGEDAAECAEFKKVYRSLCPTEWVEKWNEQLAKGAYPVKFDTDAKKH
jgi:cytochrome c oxidase subunit 6b